MAYNTPPDGNEPGGGASTEVIGEAGVSATVEMTTASAAESVADWSTIIPEELREKEHFKNILKHEKPGEELARQFDNAQTLIGKRPAGVPTEDSPQEDWDKFFEAARPKEKSAYTFEPLDLGEDKKEISDFINGHRDDAEIAQYQEIMHKWGLSKKQAEGLAKDVESLITVPRVAKQLEEKAARDAELDAGFDDLFKKEFGGSKDKAERIGSDFLKEHLPENLKKFSGGLPNEVLAMVAGMAMSVQNKYDKPDNFNTGEFNAADTVESVTADMHALMRKPGYTNAMAGDHEVILKEVQALREKKARLISKKS